MLVGINCLVGIALEGTPGSQVFPGLGIIRRYSHDICIGISCQVTFTHLLVYRCQHVIAGAPCRIEGKHLVGNGEGFIVATHIKVEAGKFGVT